MRFEYYGENDLKNRKFEVKNIFLTRYYEDFEGREDEKNVRQYESLNELTEDAASLIQTEADFDEYYSDLRRSDVCEVYLSEDFIDVEINFSKGDWATSIKVAYSVEWLA